MTTLAEPTIDTRPANRWFVLVVLALSTLVISVDNTILNVALPTITRTIGASSSQLQWIVDSYTLVFAGLLLVAGALGDRYGRKLMLALGLGWFAAMAVFAAVGHSPTHLIIGRGLMGVGAAFIFPSTLSLLTTTFRDPVERAKAIGVWVSVSSLSMVIGPLSGGLLVDHFGWHAVFLVNVPFCLFALLGVLVFIPESHRDKSTRLDLVGAFLSVAAMGTLLLGIIEAPEWGWTDPKVLAALVVAGALGLAFYRWEQYTPAPMLDVSLFRNRVFSSASLSVTMTFFATFGASLLTTVYFQSVEGFSALRTGLMMMPIAAAMMVIGPTVARIVERFGTRDVMTAGLTLLFVSLLMHASHTVMASGWLGIIPRFLLGAGMGLVMPPATMAIMSSLPPERAGVGSAMNDTTRQTGGALGVAIVGSIVSAAYRRFYEAPVGVAVEVAEQAKESIGRALVTAAELPAEVLDRLVLDARETYIDAVRYGYWASAAVLLLTIVFVRRNVPATRLVHGSKQVVEEPAADPTDAVPG